jgi:hypothetical protein
MGARVEPPARRRGDADVRIGWREVIPIIGRVEQRLGLGLCV